MEFSVFQNYSYHFSLKTPSQDEINYTDFSNFSTFLTRNAVTGRKY